VKRRRATVRGAAAARQCRFPGPAQDSPKTRKTPGGGARGRIGREAGMAEIRVQNFFTILEIDEKTRFSINPP
jgi:hypothetical protein